MSETNRKKITLDQFGNVIKPLTGWNDLTYSNGTQAQDPDDSTMYFENGTSFQSVDVDVVLNSGWSFSNVSGSWGTQGAGFDDTIRQSNPVLTISYDGTTPTFGGDYTLEWDLSGGGGNTDNNNSNQWAMSTV